MCAGVLAAVVTRGTAPAGSGRDGQQVGVVGGGFGVAGRLDAVQQRFATGRSDRHRRPDHLRADRTGDQFRSAHPCGVGHPHRCVHPGYPADRADRRGRTDRRWPAHSSNPGAAPRGGGHLASGGSTAGRRNDRAHGGIRRSDSCDGAGGDSDPHRYRPKPGVVHRKSALLLSDSADGRRVIVTPVRFSHHRIVAVHVDVHHVAPQADSRRCTRSGLASDGRHFCNDVHLDVHSDQMGPPLRLVRCRRCGDGRPCDRAGITDGAAMVAQPYDRGDSGAIRARPMLRHHQWLVVRLQLRGAV